jgi:hypothetical protein
MQLHFKYSIIKQIFMQTFKTFFSSLLVFVAFAATAQTKVVDHFNKIIVSPYIQVTFIQGDQESVTIDDIEVDSNKLLIEVNDNTLRIYLEGAKDFPKYEKDYSNGYEETHPLYNKTSVEATVTYKTLEALSLRGEETQFIKSPIEAKEFTLKIYGESEVIFNEMNVQAMETTMYGESTLEIKSGTIKEQKYTCYGDGKINCLATNGNTSRITVYGEADFKMNVADRIKITSYGSAQLHYKGTPEIVKGLHFGDMLIDKMD